MPRISRCLRTMAMVLAFASFALAETDRPLVNVGVVLDGPEPPGGTLLLQSREALLDSIRQETRALAAREYDVRFPAKKLLVADWTVEGVGRAIDRLMGDPEVDIVLSIGPFATDELGRRGPLAKPAIGLWAIDRTAQQLPFVNDTTGVRNFNYLLAPGSVLQDLDRFHDVVSFERVHVLVDSRFVEVLPEISTNVTALAESLGMELVLVPASDSAGDALAALPADAEAVYVTPLLRMPSAQFDELVAGLNARRLPTFSLLGRIEVDRGILACVRGLADQTRLARRVALNVQRILHGEDAGSLPITVEVPERLVINMATARAIGVFPSWRIRLEAELINDVSVEAGRLLTLERAVREAIEANLTLRATDLGVAAGRQNVALARSTFLPRIDAFGQGARIDEDRAEASFGSQAEKTGTVGVSLTQLVYSDAARANLRIAGDLQRSLEWDRETARLDIALAASRAYLDVLRAQTLLRVADDNLRLTESNLDLAKRRQRIGASGPADVYRWESALATSRSDRIAAGNVVLEARAAVNRLRNRPLEEPFTTESPTLRDSWLKTCCERIDPFVNNPVSYEVFRGFVVSEALANSTELRTIDAAVAAQERVLLAARRAFWAPDVALRGAADRDFWRDGAGSVPPPLITVADRNSWSIALEANLPLFTGLSRRAEVRQATEELGRLRVERRALAEAIELRVRTALFRAGSSYPAIELTREAADAAAKNLDLVTDSYSRGAVPIIDLLDAQNAALSAELFAATALYDFLLDLMEIQRASNTFDFFMSDEGREAWYGRLERFYVESGYPLPRRR